MPNVLKPQRTLTVCHDCDARPGEYHRLGCDVERCPYCGNQMLMCLMTGCPEADGAPWPPPLDDRMAWSGEWPGAAECREFGWYSRWVPGKGWVPCDANAPGAREDLNRLAVEAESDRENKRSIRTTLRAGFDEMGRQNIVRSMGRATTRSEAARELSLRGLWCVEHDLDVAGYAFYTWQGKRKKQRGKDFAVYFGQIIDPQSGPIGLPPAEVGGIVCGCLAKHGVEHRWEGDPERPIRIVTASIATLSPS